MLDWNTVAHRWYDQQPNATRFRLFVLLAAVVLLAPVSVVLLIMVLTKHVNPWASVQVALADIILLCPLLASRLLYLHRHG